MDLYATCVSNLLCSYWAANIVKFEVVTVADIWLHVPRTLGSVEQGQRVSVLGLVYISSENSGEAVKPAIAYMMVSGDC